MRREIMIQLPKVEVGGILDLPEGNPRAALTLAHGAGVGMYHKFMLELATKLVAGGVAVLRFQFPFMQFKKKMADPPKIAVLAVNAAVKRLAEECPGIPVFASGKSYGGRMSTIAASEESPPPIQGLISFGYPLHPAGTPSVERGAHLGQVKVPHLILQGDRDELAQINLLQGVVKDLKWVKLHVLKGADHGFEVLKSSGRTREEVMDEVVRESVAFLTASR